MSTARYLVLVCLCLSATHLSGRAQELNLQLRSQQPAAPAAECYHSIEQPEWWQPNQTAVIVCDMWDSHPCVNAARRGAELAPHIDRFVRELRGRGATIIHAPSSCMEHYAGHPARMRAQATPLLASLPVDIENWCDHIPSEEAAAYPVDQSAGGCDDEPLDHQQWGARLAAAGRNPQAAWQAQCAAIAIDDKLDYLSDSGPQIWSILAARGISHVMLVGVHTNMCVLGRPFGLRRLASNGMQVVLVRDLTDTMIDPRAWPYANHFSGTDLIVRHIERFVCPTISSSQVLGGDDFRYARDRRVRLVMLIAEDEYQTEESLPPFAAKHLSQQFCVTTCFGSATEHDKIIGMEAIDQADALLVSVRRRPLAAADLQRVRAFVASGKPMIGIRTASHAFSLRDNQAPVAGAAAWPEFDAEVWGGNYTGHFDNDLQAHLEPIAADAKHPILTAANLTSEFLPAGSLYRTAPLLPGTQLLLSANVEGQTAQPLAWTFVRNDSGRSFYTSLGHVDDFAQPQFEALLSAGIHWACGLQPHSRAEVEEQNQRYASGGGKQR